MAYIVNSLKFTLNNTPLLLAFVAFSLTTLPVQVLQHMGYYGRGLGILFLAITVVISMYFLAGVYSSIWKGHLNQKPDLNMFFVQAKKYFPTMILVSILIGLISFIIMMVLMVAHISIFQTDIALELYHKQIGTNIVMNVSALTVGLLFAYALPCIFVLDIRRIEVMKAAVKFLRSHLNDSKPVILLLALAFVVKVTLGQFASQFDQSSLSYWKIYGVNLLITTVIAFITFLTASQILHDYHLKKQAIAEDKS